MTEQKPVVTLDSVPPYDESPYVELNGNQPLFAAEDYRERSYETYSLQDFLGRCGPAVANLGRDLMPTEERGDISQVYPSGWDQTYYDGSPLYNRCHLIGFQLTGENANEENLITGTRYMNVEGMLPFENQVADYIKETGNHVLYRVTPVFGELELVARGVQMEALSVEDDGRGICFHVYVYNVQPGVEIDYATGDSYPAETSEELTEEQEWTDYLNDLTALWSSIQRRLESSLERIASLNWEQFDGRTDAKQTA